MTFCDAAACPSCPLAGNVPSCLRSKAQFCMRLARMPCATGVQGALEKMSLYLLAEADALDKEMTVLARLTERSEASASATAIDLIDAEPSTKNARSLVRRVAVR